jgi:hypothetical protein
MKSKRRGETATDHRFYPLSNARKKNPKKLTKHRPRAPSAVSLELRGLLLLLLLLSLPIGPNTTLGEACGALGDVGRGRARVGVVVVFRGGGGLGEEKKKIERRRV